MIALRPHWAPAVPVAGAPRRCGRCAAALAWSGARRGHGAAAVCGALALASRRRLFRRAASSETSLLRELANAAEELDSILSDWEALPVNGTAVDLVPQLKRRELALRDSLADCEVGNPADTFIVPQHMCSQPMVAAHSRVTRALIEAELARITWEVRCAEVLGHDRPGSLEVKMIASMLIDMVVLHLRLMHAREAYDLLLRAVALGARPDTDERVGQLLRSTAMCQMLREPGGMTGVDLSVGSRGEALLAGLRDRLVASGYTVSDVMQATKATSIIDFSNEDLAGELEQNLLASAESRLADDGIDLIRTFLLHRLLPLPRLRELLGVECCQLLLQLQAVTAIEGCELVPVEEAVAKVATDTSNSKDCFCFSNIKIWPVEADLLIATDEQTWPCDGFEPVMYLSDDSFALATAAPRVEATSVLDLCCGSGVQGIVALRNYARSATFVDLNPRALRFARFNLALNRLGHKAAGLHAGSLYEALPPGTQPYDCILANPPFLPNPQGIASQAIAMFGDGGALGEQVLEAAVRGCPRWLTPWGRLAAVTYAPNVDEMPARLDRWLAGVPCEATVFSGNLKAAEDFSPVSSEVELKCYQEALREVGVKTLSEAITLVRLTDQSPQKAKVVGPRAGLFEDQAFLESLARNGAGIES